MILILLLFLIWYLRKRTSHAGMYWPRLLVDFSPKSLAEHNSGPTVWSDIRANVPYRPDREVDAPARQHFVLLLWFFSFIPLTYICMLCRTISHENKMVAIRFMDAIYIYIFFFVFSSVNLVKTKYRIATTSAMFLNTNKTNCFQTEKLNALWQKISSRRKPKLDRVYSVQ